MAVYTYEIDTEHNIYPNLTVEKRLRDGELSGWRVTANSGYVFYDANAHDTRLDPETMEEIPVTYYYTIQAINPYFNWDNFSLIAVLRSSVDENYIFGVGDNDHVTA